MNEMINTKIPGGSKKPPITIRSKLLITGRLLVLLTFILILSHYYRPEAGNLSDENPGNVESNYSSTTNDYHEPIQLSSNYPSELLVEPVARETITINVGQDAKTIYNYDSKNDKKTIIALYTAAFTTNGWVITESEPILSATKDNSVVDIEVEEKDEGSQVIVILRNRQ